MDPVNPGLCESEAASSQAVSLQFSGCIYVGLFGVHICSLGMFMIRVKTLSLSVPVHCASLFDDGDVARARRASALSTAHGGGARSDRRDACGVTTAFSRAVLPVNKNEQGDRQPCKSCRWKPGKLCQSLTNACGRSIGGYRSTHLSVCANVVVVVRARRVARGTWMWTASDGSDDVGMQLIG
jgi:hypothetical protein